MPSRNSTSTGAADTSNRRWLWFGLLLVPYAALVHRLWFVSDDAFISFRYARNLVRGLGLRFNSSENPPVEGFSNLLWTLICALYEWVGLDLTVWVPFTSIGCGVAVLALVYRRLLQQDVAILPALLATAGLALFPPFAAYSTSGLETMAFALLILLLVDQLILRPPPLNGVCAGIVALLLSLTRVEGVAWALAIIAFAAAVRLGRERCLRPLLISVSILAVGFGSFLLFRFSYFHSLVSNTAYAKGQFDWPHFVRGLNYVASSVLTFPSAILLVPASVVALFVRPRGPALALVALFWAFPLYSAVVGGDFMGFGRFLVPAAPLGAILLGLLFQQIARQRSWGQPAAVSLVLLSITLNLLPAWNQHVVPESIRSQFRYYLFGSAMQSEYDRWEAQVENSRDWSALGRALDNYAESHFPPEPTPTLCTGAIGAIGYYSRLNIYDHCGLVTPEIAHRVVAPDEPLRSAGHDKAVQPEYFLKYRPSILNARIIRQLTPGEAADKCARFLDSIRPWQDDPEPRRLYFGDFARVSEIDAAGRADYLLVQVIAPSAAAAKDSWAEQDRRIKQLAGGGHAPLLTRGARAP